MNYSSSTNAYLDYSLSYSTGTAKLGDPLYFKKKYSYIAQGPVLYRLNMPFDPNSEILPVSILNYPQQEYGNFQCFINDALKRYKELNNGTVFDLMKVDDFLVALINVCDTMSLQPYIIFNKFTTKVQMVINNNTFVLDYDYDDPNTIFILSSKEEILTVKESTLNKLEETLRTF